MLLSSCSVVSNSVTPWTAARQASLSFAIFRSLLRLISTESVMPNPTFVLCCPLFLLPSVFPSIRVFSNESALCIRWPKYWSFSFSISPSNEYSGLYGPTLTFIHDYLKIHSFDYTDLWLWDLSIQWLDISKETCSNASGRGWWPELTVYIKSSASLGGKRVGGFGSYCGGRINRTWWLISWTRGKEASLVKNA